MRWVRRLEHVKTTNQLWLEASQFLFVPFQVHQRRRFWFWIHHRVSVPPGKVSCKRGSLRCLSPLIGRGLKDLKVPLLIGQFVVSHAVLLRFSILLTTICSKESRPRIVRQYQTRTSCIALRRTGQIAYNMTYEPMSTIIPQVLDATTGGHPCSRCEGFLVAYNRALISTTALASSALGRSNPRVQDAQALQVSRSCCKLPGPLRSQRETSAKTIWDYE